MHALGSRLGRRLRDVWALQHVVDVGRAPSVENNPPQCKLIVDTSRSFEDPALTFSLKGRNP